MVAWPCMSPGFMEQRTEVCFCITCVPPAPPPGRAGGTPDGEDTAKWAAALAVDNEPIAQPNFNVEETPPKTVIPFAPGERASGMTPGDCPGWMQTNYRVAMSYNEAGRLEMTPVHLSTPARDKK